MRGIARGCMLSFGLIVMVLCLFVMTPSHSHAAINPQINFQGKLTNPDGTNVTNGTYSIVFSIYSVASGGSSVWTETQASVTITDGIFQVALGSVTPLPGSVDFNSASLFLGIKVGADAEMTPRVQLAAAPYAFNADRLGGVTSAGFVQLSPGSQQTGFINVSGNATVGGTYNGNIFSSSALTFSAVSAASIQSAGSQALNVTGNAASTFSTSSGTLTIQSGSGTVSLGSSTLLSSTGTLSINSGAATALTLDSGTTGAINLGTSANAKTISIGNFTGATSVLIDVGAGTNVFNIQGPGSDNLFQIDSTNDRLYVGNPTADATGVVFILDSKNNAGDPTGVAGAMYYNSSTATFRCFENGAWKDCLGKKRIFLTADDINNNAVANTFEDVVGLAFPVVSGSTYGYECSLYFTAAANTTGSRWSLNGPTTSLLNYTSWYPNSATTIADTANYAVTAYNTGTLAAASPVSGGKAGLSGRATFTASGNVNVRFASEIAGSAITAKTNSWCDYWVQ